MAFFESARRYPGKARARQQNEDQSMPSLHLGLGVYKLSFDCGERLTGATGNKLRGFRCSTIEAA